MITARTPKEKWALAIWNKMNETRIEKGIEPFDEMDGIHYVREHSGRSTTIAELEYEYKRRKEELEKARKENKLAAYWETEEGQAKKAELEAKMEKLREQWKASKQNRWKKIERIVKKSIGEGWGIGRLSYNSVTIGMTDPEKPQDFVFGQTIECYYDAEYPYYEDGEFKRSEKFEFNIGGCGSFDAITDDPFSRAQFYIGAGKLLADKEALEGIKAEMGAMAKASANLRKKSEKIEHELNNPFEA